MDELGPSVKYKKRVAIKKTDLVRLQDSFVRTQGYSCKEPEKKKATQEDIDKMDAKMQKGSLCMVRYSTKYRIVYGQNQSSALHIRWPKS